MIDVALSSHLTDVLSDLPDTERERIVRAIRKIQNQQFDSGLRVKKLQSRPDVAVWEARFSDYGRLLFTYGEHPDRASGKPTTVVHCWTAVFDHDDVPRELRRKQFEAPETMQWLLADEADDISWEGRSMPENPGADLEAIEEDFPGDDERWDAYAALSSEYPPAWTAPPENLPWYLEGPVAFETWAEAQDVPAELILTKEQINLLQEPLPMFLNGPAGSGKTTLALYRLLVLQENDPDANTAFITQNPRLVRHAEELYMALPTWPEEATPVDFLTYRDLIAKILDLSRSEFREKISSRERLRDMLAHRHLTQADRQLFETEIWSVIKGMLPLGEIYKSSEDINNLLTPTDYEDLPDKWSISLKRSEAYQLARQYQEILREESKFDDQDMATLALQTLLTEDQSAQYNQYDTLILDEVQDLTEKQLRVAFSAMRNKNERQVFLTGDPTQVLNGSGFGWRMPKAVFYHRDWKVPDPHTLKRSFRAGAPLLRLSQGLATLLRKEKAQVVPLDPEKARQSGPTPKRTCPDTAVDEMLSKEHPDLLVLVEDDQTARELRERWGHPFVWSIAEAKGLEADHVVMYQLADKLEDVSPMSTDAQKASARQWNQRVLRTHYVGATRARHSITIVVDPDEKNSVWNREEVRDNVNQVERFRPVWTENETQKKWRKRASYYRDREQWGQAAECYRNTELKDWAMVCQWIADPSTPPSLATIRSRNKGLSSEQARVLLECEHPIHDLTVKVHLLRVLGRNDEADAVQARYDEKNENWVDAAEYYRSQKEDEKAGTLYQKAESWDNAVACFRSSGNWVRGARCLKEKGDWKAASEYYQRANQLGAAARCHLEVKEWKKAGSLFQEAGEQDWAMVCQWIANPSIPPSLATIRNEVSGFSAEQAQVLLECERPVRNLEVKVHVLRVLGRDDEADAVQARYDEENENWIAASEYHQKVEAWSDAARCWINAEEWENAGDAFLEIEKWRESAEYYTKAEEWDKAALCFKRQGKQEWERVCSALSRYDEASAIVRAVRKTQKQLPQPCASFLLDQIRTIEDVDARIWLLERAGEDKQARTLRQKHERKEEAVSSNEKRHLDSTPKQQTKNTKERPKSGKDDSIIESRLREAGGQADQVRDKGSTQLHRAAKNGSVASVRSLLDSGADPNCTTDFSVTPLHNAAFGGYKSVVQLLINAGANPNYADAFGDIPLHKATEAGAEQVVQLLLNAGSDPNFTGDEGDTPLHLAAFEASPGIIQQLLDSGADPNCVADDGTTPLHRAVLGCAMNSREGLKAIQLLLDSGANPNLKADGGQTPIQYAANAGFAEVERLLAENAVPPEGKSTSEHNAKSEYQSEKKSQTVEVLQERAFITTWRLSVWDPSESQYSIVIPTAPETEYDFTIDWGDGTTEKIKGVNPNPAHDYGRPGTYAVAIKGLFPRIFLDASPIGASNGDPENADKLQTVEQWGAIKWQSMQAAFAGASSLLIQSDDTPNLSAVTNMAAMFVAAKSFNQDIGRWDVSSVTNMGGMFWGASAFNQDIGGWNTSNVTNMTDMFHSARSFDQDIERWNVSNVAHMTGMFLNACSFNRHIGGWDVSSATDMGSMFQEARSFDQDISGWDVSNVKSMNDMFSGAISFNQDLSSWDVQDIRTYYMFAGASSFDPAHAPSGMGTSNLKKHREPSEPDDDLPF